MSSALGATGDVLHIGASSVRVEGPDLLYIVFVGTMSTEAFRELIGALHRFAAGKDAIYVVADMRRGSWLSQEGRRTGMEAPVNIRGVALISASFSLRTLATLLGKAFMLLHPEVDLTMAFFETEVEARANIDERRRSVQARAGRGRQVQ